MESLLLQLAMVAMSQFGEGMRAPMGMNPPLPGRPTMPIRYPQIPVMSAPRPRIPAYPQRSSTMQAGTLAATTCLLRSGKIDHEQAILILNRQGQRLGWSPNWGRSIPLQVVDRTISLSGGCAALLDQIQGEAASGITQIAGTSGSRSEQEGFGLYPYR